MLRIEDQQECVSGVMTYFLQCEAPLLDFRPSHQRAQFLDTSSVFCVGPNKDKGPLPPITQLLKQENDCGLPGEFSLGIRRINCLDSLEPLRRE